MIKLNLYHYSEVWSKEETEALYWYYVQSKKNSDVIGSISELFQKSELRSKSRIAIIQQLLQQVRNIRNTFEGDPILYLLNRHSGHNYIARV